MEPAEYVKEVERFELERKRMEELTRDMSDMVVQRKAEANAIGDDVEKITKSAVQKKLVSIFRTVFGRAAVSTKQVFCKIDGGELVVVVGPYGLALQKSRGEQARRVSEWRELECLVSERDAVVASLRASSLKGVQDIAKKFELFTNIIVQSDVRSVPHQIWLEVPFVQPVLMLGSKDPLQTATALVVAREYTGLECGVRIASEEVSSSYAHSAKQKVLYNDMVGAYVLSSIDKEWRYYLVKLKEQAAQKYGPCKRVLELMEEAFGAELMVASL